MFPKKISLEKAIWVPIFSTHPVSLVKCHKMKQKKLQKLAGSPLQAQLRGGSHHKDLWQLSCALKINHL
jgi:hypothetical protein